jgi:hypothetical protein
VVSTGDEDVCRHKDDHETDGDVTLDNVQPAAPKTSDDGIASNV